MFCSVRSGAAHLDLQNLSSPKIAVTYNLFRLRTTAFPLRSYSWLRGDMDTHSPSEVTSVVARLRSASALRSAPPLRSVAPLRCSACGSSSPPPPLKSLTLRFRLRRRRGGGPLLSPPLHSAPPLRSVAPPSLPAQSLMAPGAPPLPCLSTLGVYRASLLAVGLRPRRSAGLKQKLISRQRRAGLRPRLF
jgi:hypothetical protein